jgi:hypothetical protein
MLRPSPKANPTVMQRPPTSPYGPPPEEQLKVRSHNTLSSINVQWHVYAKNGVKREDVETLKQVQEAQGKYSHNPARLIEIEITPDKKSRSSNAALLLDIEDDDVQSTPVRVKTTHKYATAPEGSGEGKTEVGILNLID